MRGTQPYPFARLRRMTAGDAARRTRLARRLGVVSAEAAVRAVRELVGAPVAVTPGVVGLCPSALLDRVIPERAVAIAIASTSDPVQGRVVVELDAATAYDLVAALLGAPEGSPEAGVLGELEAGALLYLAARVVRALGDGAYQVVGLLGSRAAVRAALGEGDLAFWPLSVRVGDGGGAARVWLAEGALGGTRAARAPEALAAIPLTLRLSRGRATLRASELAALAEGDAVVLDEATPPGELVATVAGSRRTALRCALDGASVVVQEIVPGGDAGGRAAWKGERMDATTDAEAGITRAGDVEVELTVDVARVRVRLGELGRIRPGEVLGTAVDVGARVRVRAGELDVAEGELVDVDGKLGVLVTAVFPTSAGG